MLMLNEKGEYKVIEETSEDVIDIITESSEDDKLSELLDGLSEVKSLAEVRNTAQKVKGV